MVGEGSSMQPPPLPPPPVTVASCLTSPPPPISVDYRDDRVGPLSCSSLASPPPSSTGHGLLTAKSTKSVNPSLSPIATPQYWEQLYSQELRHFRDTQSEGDDWFESHIHRVLRHMFNRPELNPETDTLLDLGCGNALFLLKLADRGWVNLEGIDYSPSAIRFARELIRGKNLQGRVKVSQRDILNSEALNPDMKVAPMAQAGKVDGKEKTGDVCETKETSILPLSEEDNFLSSSPSPPRPSSSMEDATATLLPPDPPPIDPELLLPLREEGYDVLHDKGTFDVVWMANSIAEYMTFLCRYLKPRGLFILSSCNCTAQELRSIFSPRFSFIASVNHPTFEFGGGKGQSLVTLLFRNVPDSKVPHSPSRVQ